MAISGKKLELEEKAQHPEDQVDDVMPSPFGLWKMPQPIAEVIAGYVWDTPLERPSLFSGTHSIRKKISFLVEYSGPLDRFKYLVTNWIENEKLVNEIEKIKNPYAVENYSFIDTVFSLGDTLGTLMQHLVIRLDLNFRKQDGTIIDDGMAECFAKIVKNLLPHRYSDILKQARTASPFVELETKITREVANKNKLEKLFNVFTQEDENNHIQQAIEGCDLFLVILRDEDHETMNDLLLNANKKNTPILVYIERKDKFMMGGDPNENGDWDWISLDTLISEQVTFLQQLPFDQGIIYRNDKHFTPLINLLKLGHGAIETFNDFVENTKLFSVNEQGYRINDLYDKNIILLISMANKVMDRRARELPGLFYGNNANRFCIEIIGGILQSRLSSRGWQILRCEGRLEGLLIGENKVTRSLDPGGTLTRGVRGSNWELGVNFYYDIKGRMSPGVRTMLASLLVSQLITSNNVSIQTLCDSPQPALHPPRACSVM